MSVITITNDGPWLVASDYWGSDLESAGKVYCSPNAGCVRVLVPRTAREIIRECQSGRYCVLSRGPWPAEGLAEAVEPYVRLVYVRYERADDCEADYEDTPKKQYRAELEVTFATPDGEEIEQRYLIPDSE